MKQVMVEGTILAAEKMTDEIMKEHMAYTQKAMDDGMILLSGLKADRSGGIFLMKAETLEAIELYLAEEPFHRYGIQDYRLVEFQSHYMNQSLNEWFS